MNRDTELILVFGLDVSLEVTGIAKCFTTMETLMRLLTEMDSFNVSVKVTSMGACFRTMRTTERFFLRVASDVQLEL